MPDISNIQYKLKMGYKITPAEQAFLDKAADKDGVVSRRKFTGIAEYPDSVIDLD